MYGFDKQLRGPLCLGLLRASLLVTAALKKREQRHPAAPVPERPASTFLKPEHPDHPQTNHQDADSQAGDGCETAPSDDRPS